MRYQRSVLRVAAWHTPLGWQPSSTLLIASVYVVVSVTFDVVDSHRLVAEVDAAPHKTDCTT